MDNIQNKNRDFDDGPGSWKSRNGPHNIRNSTGAPAGSKWTAKTKEKILSLFKGKGNG